VRYCRTTSQLNTPFNDPEREEITVIEVTDSAHPLFGRRFEIISITTPLHSPGHVYVRYREKMVLHIPVPATNLTEPRRTIQTKLTSQAVEEFISLANHCEVLCQSNRKKSGSVSPQNSNNKSLRESRRSFRR
jgi:hypothetical protein